MCCAPRIDPVENLNNNGTNMSSKERRPSFLKFENECQDNEDLRKRRGR